MRFPRYAADKKSRTADGGRAARRTDIWITKSLPELSSGEREKNKQAKKKKKKIQTLNFPESNAHRKTNARGSFET